MGRSSGPEPFHRPFAKLATLKERAKSSRLATTPAPRAPHAEPPKRSRSEAEIFLEEVAGTAPLTPRGGRVSVAPHTGHTRTRLSDDAEVLAKLADLCDGEGPFDVSDSDEYIEGLAAGVDRRLLKRLRAGDYAVQAHVDLHGLTQAEAKDKVGTFVAESRRAGRRCVLLVHGRGLHSKDQIPVLKQAVRSWLERGHIARSVLAFASARPCDGGPGAVYVLLRR